MQVWSLVTRRPGREEVVWSGLYYVHSLGESGYVVGRCVCLYCDDVGSYPLHEPYSVGERSGRFIEFNYIKRNGTLIFDDGQEIASQRAMVS